MRRPGDLPLPESVVVTLCGAAAAEEGDVGLALQHEHGYAEIVADRFAGLLGDGTRHVDVVG